MMMMGFLTEHGGGEGSSTASNGRTGLSGRSRSASNSGAGGEGEYLDAARASAGKPGSMRLNILGRESSGGSGGTAVSGGQSMRWSSAQLVERQRRATAATVGGAAKLALMEQQLSVAKAFQGTLPSQCYEAYPLSKTKQTIGLAKRGGNMRLLRLGTTHMELVKPQGTETPLHSIPYGHVTQVFLLSGDKSREGLSISMVFPTKYHFTPPSAYKNLVSLSRDHDHRRQQL